MGTEMGVQMEMERSAVVMSQMPMDKLFWAEAESHHVREVLLPPYKVQGRKREREDEASNERNMRRLWMMMKDTYFVFRDYHIEYFIM
jgi:hypothetical protein